MGLGVGLEMTLALAGRKVYRELTQHYIQSHSGTKGVSFLSVIIRIKFVFRKTQGFEFHYKSSVCMSKILSVATHISVHVHALTQE